MRGYNAAIVVAYALSPIDLIPDIIPILGYLDDLILVPLGIMLVLRMIPPVVLIQCREQAETAMVQDKPTSWIAAVVVVAIVLGFIVTEHFDDVFGKLLLNFSVSKNRLRNFRSWVLIPIMLTAMTNEDTTHFLKLLD